MSTKENKEAVRQGMKEWNEFGGDVAKMRSWYYKWYAPGFIAHDLSQGDMNLQQTIQHTGRLMSAFPDINFTIDDMVAEGDKVVVRYTWQGTHKGTVRGMPPTGKQVKVKGIELEKIVGRKCLESWDFADSLGLMVQLGVVPGAASKT